MERKAWQALRAVVDYCLYDPQAGMAFARSGGKGSARGHLYLSGYGAYGRFLRGRSHRELTELAAAVGPLVALA